MMPSNKKNKRTSIRTLFAVFPLIVITLVLIPGIYFAGSSAVLDAEIRAFEKLTLETERLTTYVGNVFSTVEKLNAINVANVENGNLNYRSQEALQQYFLAQVRQYNYISSIYFGNVEGGLANAGRDAGADDEYYLIGTESFVAGDFLKYAVDESGKRTSVLAEVSDFDSRSRSWYQLADEKGDAVWTDVYQLFTEQDMAISGSQPVYAEDGSLLGVMSADIFISQLSDFLSDKHAYQHGQSILIDRDGYLLASSEYPVLGSLEQNKNYEHFDLETINSAELNALYEYLLAEEIDLQQVDRDMMLSYKTGDDKYFVSISPITRESGLDWIAIVLLEEENFFGNLVVESRVGILAFIISLALVIFVFVRYSHAVVSPLLSLRDKIRNIEIDNPEDISLQANFYELQELIDAFSNLTGRLGTSMSELGAEIDDHETSKKQLEWREALYRSVVEDSPGLLCSFLPSGELTFVNKAYAEYYGSTPEEMVSRNFQDHLHEDDREMVMRELHGVDQANLSASLVHRIILPSGETRYQRWVNRALLSENGEVIGYQAFGEDIQTEYQDEQAQQALNRVWRISNQIFKLEEFYPEMYKIIQEIIPSKHFVLALWDQEEQALNSIYAAGADENKVKVSCFRSGPGSYVIENKSSLRCTPDEFKEFDLSDSDFDKGDCQNLKAWLGVPLLLDDEAIGVLVLQDYENEEAFTAHHQEFLEVIASSVAATIARRRAEEETALYAGTNLLLLKTSQTISELLDLSLVYHTLYEFVSEIMPCDVFMVSDYNNRKKQIACEYLVQEGNVQDVSDFPALPLNPDGEGTQSRAIVQKKSRLVGDYLSEVKTSHSSYYVDENGNLQDIEDADMNKPITRSALIVPMLFRDEVNGVIQVMSYRENAYSKNDLYVVKALSSQVGVARNNVGLLEQREHEIAMRAQAEIELQAINLELEERVRERTKEIKGRIGVVERLNTGMSNILHDLQIANKITQEKSRALEAANEELESFSYSVSHDLRAPLRHIASFSDLLYKAFEDRMDEKEERYFTNIFTATGKMRNLIQDLLALSKAGRTDLNLVQVDMNEIVESARAELFDEIEDRKITWTLGTLPTAQADQGLIRVVWVNLIGNAVKYTRLRKDAKIEIGAFPPEKDELGDKIQTFFVQDNGVGFDEAYIDQLFGVFQRLHQGTEFDGNGIGLATVRRIISRHSGRTWAKGKLNEGATFYFSLPVRMKLADD